MLKTREEINNDNKSQFAKLVKASWKYQKENGFSENIETLGKWPISKTKLDNVFFADLFIKETSSVDFKEVVAFFKNYAAT